MPANIIPPGYLWISISMYTWLPSVAENASDVGVVDSPKGCCDSLPNALESAVDAASACIVCVALFHALLNWRFLARRPKQFLGSLHYTHTEVTGSAPQEAEFACRRNVREKLCLIDTFEEHAWNGSMEDMMKVLSEIENNHHQRLTSADYNRCVTRLARCGKPIIAHNWLRRALDVGCGPSPSTFNSVISSYVKTKAFSEALQVANEMSSAGLDYDTATYNMIIDAWARMPDVARAQCWMKRMLDAKVPPNIISFSTIMRACAEAGSFEDLEEWFRASQAYGSQLDLLSFRSVVRAFAKKDDAVNAMKWLMAMIEYGVQPEITDLMLVFSAIFKKIEVGLAVCLIDQMRAAGVKPPIMVLDKCIAFATENGHHSQARAWAIEHTARRGSTKELNRGSQKLPPKVIRAGSKESATSGCASSLCYVGGDEAEFQQKSVQEPTLAVRCAAHGKKYRGIIKESNPYRHGFIKCAATYEIFQRDIWFGQDENKEKLTKGQRVRFTLRVDCTGRTRACDLTLCL